MERLLKDKIELVMSIGNEICVHCESYYDCGIKPKDCPRIIEAVRMLNEFIINL